MKTKILNEKHVHKETKREILQCVNYIYLQWRIQDFPQGGAPTPKIAIIFHIFTENCMENERIWTPGGGGARPWRPPLDPPMIYK